MIESTIDGQDGRQILGDLVHYRTYAAVKEDGRKESREEVIRRVEGMHQKRFPGLADEIGMAHEQVYEGQVVGSMRTMQFGGMAIERSHARSYNCAYAALTSWRDFADLFWLLMNGVGAGYSVQRHHISQLPVIPAEKFPGGHPLSSPSLKSVSSHPLRWKGTFVVSDSREGWADGLIALFENPWVDHDTHLVRAKGAPLSTGGTASGPESLIEMYELVRKVLFGAVGRRLTSRECFDIMCYVADLVVVGGVRRAATIVLFDADDQEMLTAKHGKWYKDNPQRARANMSAVLLRDDPIFESKLRHILQMCFDSNCGEPGVSLTNDRDYGFNPCHEISLKDGQMCNLSEINNSACKNPKEFLQATETATILGTLQASYTDFTYLQPKWRINCEEEALLGVSMTGQAQNWRMLSDELLQQGAKLAVVTNEYWAGLLGINPAARVTTTKPSGNTSSWWGTTSGIHAAHAPFYLRRMRVDRKDEFGKYLIWVYGEHEPCSGNFIESDATSAETIVVTVPMSMQGAILREEESAIDLLERSKHVYTNWVLPGHKSGPNTHNVSLTVSYRPEETEEIKDWMVANCDYWAGIALLPYDGGNYIQAPFEEITEEEFLLWKDKTPEYVDFSIIDFSGTTDERMGELACNGISCELK